MAKRKNVLLILSDQQRMDTAGVKDEEKIRAFVRAVRKEEKP